MGKNLRISGVFLLPVGKRFWFWSLFYRLVGIYRKNQRFPAMATRTKSDYTTTLILLGAVGVGAWILYKKLRALTNLSFDAKGISTGGGGLILQLGVANPTSTVLNLKTIVGKIIVNGSPIGNVSNFIQQAIQPLAETVIPITITPDVFGSVSAVLNELTGNPQGLQSIVLDATANVGDTLIPINLNFI